MTRFSLTLLSLSLLSVAGCGDDSDADAGPNTDAGADVQTADAGPDNDAGPGDDDAGPGDAGPGDAGPTGDTGTDDAGPPADAGPSPLPEPMNHRPDRGEMCDNERASPEVISGVGGCESHEECAEGDNGRCLPNRGGNFCSYDRCFSDDDCTGPCICGNTDTAPNSCTAGGCQIDADCGPLSWCSPTFGDCGDFGGVVAYECHTAEDECTDDVDCADEGPGAYCRFSDEASHWVCSTLQCVG